MKYVKTGPLGIAEMERNRNGCVIIDKAAIFLYSVPYGASYHNLGMDSEQLFSTSILINFILTIS